MTTINRKWNYVPIVLGLFLIFASTNAHAEEDAVYMQQNAQQQANTQNQPVYDQQYQLPPSYQGKYYPNDESRIGYHGTTTSAQNNQNTQNDSGHNGSYYYYYY